jgi:hypothetical protein
LAKRIDRRPAIRPIRLPVEAGLSRYCQALGGEENLIELARLSPDSKMRQVVQVWDRLTAEERRTIPLDQVLASVDQPAEDFLAEMVRAAHRHSVDFAGLALGLQLPSVVQATVKNALTPKGTKDREMILKHAGLLPVPSNSFTAIRKQINTQINTTPPPEAPGLPSLEADNLEDVRVQRG